MEYGMEYGVTIVTLQWPDSNWVLIGLVKLEIWKANKIVAKTWIDDCEIRLKIDNYDNSESRQGLYL